MVTQPVSVLPSGPSNVNACCVADAGADCKTYLFTQLGEGTIHLVSSAPDCVIKAIDVDLPGLPAGQCCRGPPDTHSSALLMHR